MSANIQKFLKRIAILAVVLVLMDFAISKVLEHYFFRMKAGETSRTTFYILCAKEEVVIFGSSRANHHYISSIIGQQLGMSCYNSGKDG